VRAVLTVEDMRRLQGDSSRVFVSPAAQEYVVAITTRTSSHPRLAMGASPRASLALQRAAQAAAMIAGREFVAPDDIKRLAPIVLPHRMIAQGGTDIHSTEDILRSLLDEVPVPGMPE